MTSYYGRKNVSHALPEGMGRASKELDVIVETPDSMHHYLALDSEVRSNVSGRHTYRVHDSGVLEVRLTTFEPKETERVFTTHASVVRYYSSSGWLAVEGIEMTPETPKWRTN